MKFYYLKGYISFVNIFLLIPGSLIAQNARHSLNEPAYVASILDTIIQKRMDRYHIPGFAFAIVKDGKIFLSKGYGYSNLENKIRVEADKTIFRIGSVTKVFTAAAMMQLVDEQKINLNDDVNKYLEDKLTYKNNIPITLHHLLSHSEGFSEIPGRRTSGADKILPLKTFLKDRLIQDHHAGELATYGTYGIALSGLLLENISGIPYREYMQKNIFDPLEMVHTNATDISLENKNYFAPGYEYRNEKYNKMAFEYYHTFPASDINSTVNDMGNFMVMLLNKGRYKDKRVLQTSSAANMHSTQFRNDPRLVGYTHGFFESTINGTKALYHGGAMDGYASLLYMWPEKNLGLFMVCNTEEHKFLGSILNNFLYYFFPGPVQKDDHARVPLKNNIERYSGIFQRPGAPKIIITLNNDNTLSFWGGKWLQVQPGLFRVINGTLDTGEDIVAFKENENGEVTSMTTGPFVYFNIKTQKSKIKLSRREQNDLVGTYAIDEKTSFMILKKKNKLLVSVNNAGPLELIARSKNSFFLQEYNATIFFLQNNEVEIDLNGKKLKVTKIAGN